MQNSDNSVVFCVPKKLVDSHCLTSEELQEYLNFNTVSNFKDFEVDDAEFCLFSRILEKKDTDDEYFKMVEFFINQFITNFKSILGSTFIANYDNTKNPNEFWRIIVNTDHKLMEKLSQITLKKQTGEHVQVQTYDSLKLDKTTIRIKSRDIESLVRMTQKAFKDIFLGVK